MDPPPRGPPETRKWTGGTMAETTRHTDSVIPPEVTELIERSQTIRGWIEKLGEHEGETSRAVYEKVLADYRERLERVTADLRTHRADLVETLERHRAEVDALRADREDQAARLEEARLRHAVGEYDDEVWDERREGIDSKLAELDDGLTEEAATVEELEGILEAIPGDGETPSSSAIPWSAARAAVGEAKPAPGGAEPAEPVVEPATAERKKERAAATRPDPPAPAARPAPAATDEEDDRAGEEDAESGVTAAIEEGEEEEHEEVEVARAAAEDDAAHEDEPAVAAKRVADAPAGGSDAADDGSDDQSYLDELEFLESLSLDEADRFDAVSAMLEEDEGGKPASE